MNNTITTTIKKVTSGIIFTCLFLLSTISIGQQTNNWYFGSANQYVGLRIDFNSGSPVVSTCMPILTEEGSSSISDASGNPLFYTDGVKIWDASTNTTFNSTPLLGGSSSTQSAIVMPRPGFTNQWLVFTSGTNGTNGINSYIVSGSPGAFTINSTTPNNLTPTGTVGEGLFVIGSTKPGTAFWVIARGVGNTGAVMAWPVSTTGVVGALVPSTLSGPSFTNTNYCGTIGTIKSNTCQNKLAFTYLSADVDLVDFDAATGMVVANTAKRITVASSNGAGCPQGTNSGSYGLEFSPNDSLLFISNLDGGIVYKYKISTNALTTLGTMTNSAALNGWGAGQMQIGPDGVIYIARPPQQGSSTPFTPSYLSTISNPNSSTPTFTETSLLLTGVQCTSNNNYTGSVYRGLPTFPKALTSTYPTILPGDTAICRNATLNYKYRYFAGFVTNIEWDFGDPASGAANTSNSATPSHTFNNLGTFKVLLKITDNCSRVWKDSVYVQVADPKVPAGVINCTTNSLTFTGTGTPTSDYPKYVWYDAASGGTVLGVGSPTTVNYSSMAAAPTSVWVEVAGSASTSSSGSNIIGPTIPELNYSGGLSSGTQTISVLASSVTLKTFQVQTRPSFGGNFTVTITNAASATVFSQAYTAPAGATYTVNLNKMLGSGNYTISISGAAHWVMKSTGTLSYTNPGQLALGGSTPYPILTNLQYDYSNYSITSTCSQRVKIDRKCLIILPGNGTYCTGVDIPLSYTFEGTSTGQTWSITPGTAGVDWVYVSPSTSTSLSPTIRFITANNYTIKVDVTDNLSVVYTQSMAFNIIPGATPNGAISCSSTSMTLTGTGTPTSDYPNYVWYDAASGGNVLGIGSPVTLNYSNPASAPTSVWVEATTSATVTSSGSNTIGPTIPDLNYSGGLTSNTQNISVLASSVTLKTFQVQTRPGFGGAFTVTIKDASNATVFTQGYTAPAGATYTVNVNTTLGSGNYTIAVTGTAHWIMRTLLPNTYTNAGQFDLGASTSYPMIANLQYDYSNYSITHKSCIVRVKVDRLCSLPVELISFTGENTSIGNVLNWSTSMEINNDYFHLQHSTDGINFTTIGTIEGHGNSNSINEYQFIDRNPNSGINYYRLVQVDFDGQKYLSNTIKISGYTNASSFVVSPNPSTESFAISFLDLNGGEITVLDILGKELISKTIEAGTQRIEIGAEFAKGAYVVRFSGVNGISTQLIIKE